jgi:soluble lytic murein transglycosylase-like protein
VYGGVRCVKETAMRRAIIASLSAAFLVAVIPSADSAIRCSNPKYCETTNANRTVKSNVKNYAGAQRKVRELTSKRTYVAQRKQSVQQVSNMPAARQRVVAMIKSMAPSYGVPTWFALRIAKVESSYNPSARGRAGEYGVYQMKCATARLIGFRGNCSALLNAKTNVQYGLKHLSIAVKTSRGNLKLAASKHNGGLGRKRLVRAYVNRVF